MRRRRERAWGVRPTAVVWTTIGRAFEYRMEPQGCVYPQEVMDARETMNVSLGRTLLVVAASDGPPWTATS
jgi:hypothetical protein